ncbi:MAG TPA: DUF2934 domain-containing protein [Roseiflexaceae bacterium]|nr:DUF2934 domain-containing protein [Roseiflexaceae bacterium]
MLRCYGDGCPLRGDCYRFTQPSPGRDAFGSLPYDAAAGECDYFVSNLPSEEAVRAAAYYIWLREGRPGGREQPHWDEAYHSLCRSMGRMTET